MARKRSLRVLFVRPGDRQGLHPGLRFPIPREAGDVLPVELLRLASAVKFGSNHRALVHDERHPDVAGAGPVGALRSLSRALQPDVAVIWLHPATLADGLEAARQARHAGCGTVFGAGPLVALWPAAAGRVLEVDGLVSSRAGLLAALDLVESGGRATELAACLARPEAGDSQVDRKLLDYAAYVGVAGPSWPGTGRPRFARSDKGRFAASAVRLDDGALADLNECALLGIRFVDLVGEGGDDAWWTDFAAALPGGPRLRLRATPARLRRLALNELSAGGVVAVNLGTVGAGSPDVEEACAVATLARRAGLSVGVTALVGVSGYDAADEDRGVQRLQGAGIEVEVRLPASIGDDRWMDYADAPSAGFVPRGLDADRLALATRQRSGRSGVSTLIARARG